MSRKKAAFAVASVALACLLGAALSGPASGSLDVATSRAATTNRTAATSGAPKPAPSLQTPAVAPAQLVFRQNIYTGVSALTSNDVWAVGNSTKGGQWAALIRHWDGRTWTRTLGPRVPGGNGVYLNAVASYAPDDVWTVGDRFTGGDRGFVALAAHWDGARWTKVAIPRPGSESDLATLAGTSSTDVWAMGSYIYVQDGNVAERPLLEHWDGKTWTQVKADTAGMGWLAQAYSAVAIAPDDVWFVGTNQYLSYGDAVPLIEHWNGKAWAQTKGPKVASDLAAIGADQEGDIVVVGNFTQPGTGYSHPLAESRVGNHWHRVPLQHRRRSDMFLHAVGVRSANDAWTVGQKTYVGANGYRAVAEHWDGSTWQTFRTEDPYRPNQETVLLALSLDAASDAWAAGYYTEPGTNVPLVEHWNGTRWVTVSQ